MTQFILFFLKASQRMTAWHVNGLTRDYFQFLLRAQTDSCCHNCHYILIIKAITLIQPKQKLNCILRTLYAKQINTSNITAKRLKKLMNFIEKLIS